MSGKKAKAMRRAVKLRAEGMQEKAYLVDKVHEKAYNGVVARVGTFKLHPICRRAIYHTLKKEAKRNVD